MPSRLPTQASTLYGNNISKFLLSIGEQSHYNINLEDEVVRGSIILHDVSIALFDFDSEAPFRDLS